MMTRPHLHLDWIDPSALKIVETLQKHGFEAYLVGGCVRDLLAGIHPKDFDIATSARPEQVRRHISHSYVIGRRFRLVLVKRGTQQFEVATFRRNSTPEDVEEGDEPTSFQGDNFFGTIEEDAKRRDFTINSLFYDPVKNKIVDFCGGLEDIEHRILRMIGDPVARFREDSIRILRAIRLAHKLNFSLDTSLRRAIAETAPELGRSVLPRRREEFLKFLRLPHPEGAFFELYDLGVLSVIAPRLNQLLNHENRRDIFFASLARIPMSGIDLHSPIELFAAFVYCFLKSYHETDGRDCLEIMDDPITTSLLREELGVFKIEASILIRALELMPQLNQTDIYMRKGARRQQAFLSNEVFPLSLKLAQLDYTLIGKNLHFWIKEIKNQSN